MIVAIESASTDLSVSLSTPDGEPIGEDAWTTEQRQGHELLPRLLALLSKHRHALSDASAVAVGIGPGSFTGLRVGMSLAKGLALAGRIPVVGVPSLEAWLAADPGAVAAASRAGAREAYLALRDGGPDAVVVDRERLPDQIGDAPLAAPRELAVAFGLSGARSPVHAAAAVARIGAARLAESPSGDDLARLEPRYLRGPRGIGQVQTEPVKWL